MSLMLVSRCSVAHTFRLSHSSSAPSNDQAKLSIWEELMVPIHAIWAHPRALQFMPAEDKDVLIACLSLSDIEKMSIDQLVAVNPHGVQPDIRLESSNDGPEVGKYYCDKNNKDTINIAISVAPEFQWYTIIVGINFTGVCCSTNLMETFCLPSTKGCNKQGATSESIAVQQWIHAHYMKQTHMIIPS
jgi:hypothetical protein